VDRRIKQGTFPKTAVGYKVSVVDDDLRLIGMINTICLTAFFAREEKGEGLCLGFEVPQDSRNLILIHENESRGWAPLWQEACGKIKTAIYALLSDNKY
jgi:hypothetical protein